MPKKILLVEDEALIAMTEAAMLEKHGFEVVTAYNGEKAVEAVNSGPEEHRYRQSSNIGFKAHIGADGTVRRHLRPETGKFTFRFPNTPI
jgi:CheY-like chemotaxis protein